MIALTTTQQWRIKQQFLTGSLTHLTLTIKNEADDDHKRWPGTITAGAGFVIKAGIEYEIEVIPSAGSGVQDWRDIGHINGTSEAPLAVGQKFVAQAAGKSPGDDIVFDGSAKYAGARLAYGDTENALRFGLQKLASRATIVALGSTVTEPTITSAATAANASGTVNVVIENSGYGVTAAPSDLNDTNELNVAFMKDDGLTALAGLRVSVAPFTF